MCTDWSAISENKKWFSLLKIFISIERVIKFMQKWKTKQTNKQTKNKQTNKQTKAS